MDQQTVLTIFVALCALAMLIQAGMLIGVFLVAKRMEAKVTALMPEIQGIVGQVQTTIPEVRAVIPQVQSIVASTKQIVEETKKHASDIGIKATAVAEVAKGQVMKLDALLTDFSDRAKVQLDRAEMVLDDTMSRTQQTVTVVQQGVLSPIREVHGLVAGVRAAIGHLGRSRRPTVDHATSDEEMFI